MSEKLGVVSFGNWIRDKVRFVERGAPLLDPAALQTMLRDGAVDLGQLADCLTRGDMARLGPAVRHPIITEGTLTPITAIEEGTGGCPYNLLLDLAKLKIGMRLGAIGIVGKDADGQIILDDLDRYGIDRSGMRMLDTPGTSFTDVYQPAGGNRGFGHFSVLTNDRLSYDDIRANLGFIGKHRICHAGYALLLAGLDAPDEEHGTQMARALKDIKGRGVKTSLAVVSDRDSSRFPRIVRPSLRYTDVFMPNEYEAGCTTGIDVNRRTAEDAARKMFDEFGVGELVVIHMGEKGSLGMLRDGRTHYQPAHKVEKVAGTAGAGDAFEAGMLYELHHALAEGKPLNLEYGMRVGTAMAAICLGGRTCTDSMLDLGETLAFMRRTPYRK